jgi:hypothetical protein
MLSSFQLVDCTTGSECWRKILGWLRLLEEIHGDAMPVIATASRLVTNFWMYLS